MFLINPLENLAWKPETAEPKLFFTLPPALHLLIV